MPFSIQDNTNLINYTSLHLLYKKKIMKLRENEFSVQLKKKKIFKNFEMLRLFIEIKILTKQNFNENQIRQRTFLYIFFDIHRK